MDSNLWESSWFLDLSPESKNIWQYLERNCDCAGIWSIDLPQLKKRIGYQQIDLTSFITEVNKDYDKLSGYPITVKRVMLICNNSKLWFTGFISFQYEKGKSGVNPNIPAIIGVLNRLKENDIYDLAINEGYLRIQNSSKKETTTTIPKGCQPLARDKDKDNDSSSFLNISLFESQIKKELISQYGQSDVDYAIREAVKHNKNNFAYIEGICKKRKEKESVKKSLDESRQKKREQYKDLTPEERKSWSNLHLLELVYSNKPETLPLKEIGSG
jgi:DNA replication protein DnaD